MNSVLVLIVAGIVIWLGYGFYAKSIDKKVIQPDPNKATPAKMYMDGVDFIPAGRNVLFGYQFKSIAALGPIVGPIVAVQWGWLPALLWILLGVAFIGWVQDYTSIMMGVRHEGMTMGGLSYKLISPRSRNILLLFIYLYLWLIMGAFGKIVGYDLMTKPIVPFGILTVIVMGLLMGYFTYKLRQDIIWTTIVAVVISLFGIWLGAQPFMANIFKAINGSDKTIVFGQVTWAKFLWSLVVMAICYLGAVLPIWEWAQPINYVSFWIVALGMLAGVLGILVWHPGMGDFPAFTQFTVPGLGPLWPVLFVTIACGAISGWHSLVSTSGTARQLEKETDALPVGGGAMFMESSLATIALLTATAAFGSYKGYHDVYAKGKAAVFAVGLANFMNHIGIPKNFGVAYGAVFLTIMALTIMYLVVRFMRVASAELVGDSIPVMRNVHVGTIVALLLSLLIIWTGVWQRVWVLFGGANQLMASLALLLITVWLMEEGKSAAWAFWPFVFMYVTTIGALTYTGVKVFMELSKAPVGNFIAGSIAFLLIIAALFLGYDAMGAVNKARKKAHASE